MHATGSAAPWSHLPRLYSGCCHTNEHSGHYGHNWRPRYHLLFLELTSLMGFPVLHSQYDLQIGYLYAKDLAPQLRLWQDNFIRWLFFKTYHKLLAGVCVYSRRSTCHIYSIWILLKQSWLCCTDCWFPQTLWVIPHFADKHPLFLILKISALQVVDVMAGN